MPPHPTPDPRPVTGASTRIDAAGEWRSTLTRVTGAVLLFEIVSGLAVFLLPFGSVPQLTLLAHTVIGLLMVAPVFWYVVHHWLVRRRGNLSHIQLLGYIAAGLLIICMVSGVTTSWQGMFGPRMSGTWDMIHLVTGLTVVVFIVAHLLTIILRRVNNAQARQSLGSARNAFWRDSLLGSMIPLAMCVLWSTVHAPPETRDAFPETYDWSFGADRPFAPSLARVDRADWEAQLRSRVLAMTAEPMRPALLASWQPVESEPLGPIGRVRRWMDAENVDAATRDRIEAALADAARQVRGRGAVDARLLSGSSGCGSSGCHSEIYEEWLPSAHRYSAMDELFQRVQTLMADETSPEHTRYCAGCHDPISLFSGAKNSHNVTLSTLGADEGSSCLVCHSIVQTDVQGNGDYTIRPPDRYAYELDAGPVAKFVSDFLIRTYPSHHITSYARPLYKTPEFCGACHKQYIDKEVNTDIGKVQGQNQYDSWKNSRWYHGDADDRTVACRECHMPLNDSLDPARGDVTDSNRSRSDGRHRSHRMLASNQYVPLMLDLEGARQHVTLTEQWLRGEYEIPEIAHKWTDGPVVRLRIAAPEQVRPGLPVSLRVTLTNNKTGHDFPTGPLDMIESWIELTVRDDRGTVVFHAGGLDETGAIDDSPVLLKVDAFDRRGEPIDRHNLWDLVGASYKRTMFPGGTDAFDVQFQCPSMARGRLMEPGTRHPPGQRLDAYEFTAPETGGAESLHVVAELWYRKANPEFLDRVFGADAGVRSPVTRISSAEATIRVRTDADEAPE